MTDRERRRSLPPISRRRALELGAAAMASTVLASPQSVDASGRPRLASVAVDDLRPAIRPRADWAGELGVRGEIAAEDDVRFLLVHHTASTNDYGPDDVVAQIRAFYEFHTGPEKGWPDVAYNFFVDRFGVIWEGRAGSLEGPVRGDATGGSQGFALLCSLIGNHLSAPATPEAQRSLVQLLAWLAATHAIDPTPGATVTFTSRGSNRWPAGTEVTARTISGHRDMSTTTCPGDFVYDLLAEDVPTQVSRLVGPVASATPSTEPVTTTTEPSSTSTGRPSTAPTSEAGRAVAAPSGDALGAEPGSGDDGRSWPLVVAGGIAGVIAAGAAAATRIWRRVAAGTDS